jgi:SIR2-like domain
MLLVIFGAGASYDSARKFPTGPRQWRPPLSNELFDQTRFGTFIDHFQQCSEIITYLHGTTNVEHELEVLQSQADVRKELYGQLTAVRFYLQDMLSACQAQWMKDINHVTNYKALLGQIAYRRVGNEPVCLVTFNYDTLLEDALPTIAAPIRSLSDYVTGDYKVIKPHGSINWAHRIIGPNFSAANVSQLISMIIEKAARLIVDKSFEIVFENPFSRPLEPLFPAVAIPVENKPSYECPPEQLKVLDECLPEVTKILVVGWRATENRFLETLAKSIRKVPRIMVVSNIQSHADEIAARIVTSMREPAIQAHYVQTVAGGFTSFVVNRRADEFLRGS